MNRVLSCVLIACLTLGANVAPARTRTHGHARTVLAATPIARLDLPWWKQRFAEKARRLREGHVGLVWYGDSITQDWERHGPPAWANFAPAWQRFYGDREAVNLGFTGDTTANLLWRIEHGEAEGIAPKAAVILIGANNMGHVHWSAPDTVAGIEAIVGELRRRLPHTRLLLLGILPSERSAWVSRTTEEVNRALFERYGGGRVPNVTFLNETGVFVHDGQLDRGAFLDPLLKPPEPPLHPTAQAQARLAAAIEPTLSALLGDREHGG
jgi:lysophospholipase L1-like esterase